MNACPSSPGLRIALFLAWMAAHALGVAFQPGVNLLDFDTSFETGSAPWMARAEEGEAFHGRRSLLLPPGTTGFLGGVLFKRLPPFVPMTYSFHARGPGRLKVQLVNQDNWSNLAVREFDVGSEWRRYSLTIPPQLRTAAMRMDLSKDAESAIRLDAVQLNPGKDLAPYAPETAVAAGFDPLPEPGRILFASSQPLKAVLRVHSRLSQPQAMRVEWSTESHAGPCVARGSFGLESTPGDAAVSILEVLPRQTRGYYVVRVRVAAEGNDRETLATCDWPLVVADPPHPAEPSSFLGLFPCGQLPREALRRIGAAWLRPVRRWRHAERTAQGDYLFDPESRGEFHWMQTISLSAMPPEFAAPDGRLANVGEAARYMAALVGAYRDEYRVWEIENEPDLSWKVPGLDMAGRASDYADVVKAVAPRIRERQPDALILAGGISGVDFDFNGLFLRRTLQVAGSAIDVVPAHPYSHARYIDERGRDLGPGESGMSEKFELVKNIIRETGGRQDVWAGEIGWGVDCREDFLGASARRHAAYLLRTLLIARAHDVKKVMYFLSELCLENDYFYYGLWRNQSPMPAAAVFAAAGSLLENVESGREHVKGDLRFAIYRSLDGGSLGAVWMESKSDKLEMTLPLTPAEVEVRDMFNAPLVLPEGRPIKLKVDGEPTFLLSKLSVERLEAALLAADNRQFPLRVNWQVSGDRDLDLILHNITDEPVEIGGRVSGYGLKVEPGLDGIRIAPNGSTRVSLKASGDVAERLLTLDVTARRQRRRLVFTPIIEHCPGHGLDSAWSVDLEDRLSLLPADPGIPWEGAEDLSARVRLSWDEQSLIVEATVRDDVHRANPAAGSAWNGDAMQLAICPEAVETPRNHGYVPDDLELNLVLRPEGGRIEVGYAGKRTPEDVVEACRLVASRTDDKTRYRCSIPWSLFGVTKPEGTVFGINFTINDCDLPDEVPATRQYWMGLTPGIGEGKDPRLFRKFIMRKTP